MLQLLYVDGAVRHTGSRTLRLADALLAERQKKSAVAVRRLALAKEDWPPLNEARLAERSKACEKGDFSGAMFARARLLAEADEVLIAAPYYDLSFPALLKIWTEAILVPGLTFRYGENGRPVSLVHIRKVWYVTTAGGFRLSPDFGFDYVKNVFQMFFGVTDIRLLSAEGLDIEGNDPEAILAQAQSRIAAEML